MGGRLTTQLRLSPIRMRSGQLGAPTGPGRSNSQSSDALDIVPTDDQMIEQRHLKLG